MREIIEGENGTELTAEMPEECVECHIPLKGDNCGMAIGARSDLSVDLVCLKCGLPHPVKMTVTKKGDSDANVGDRLS